MFNIVFIVLLLFEYMAFVVGYNFFLKIGKYNFSGSLSYYVLSATD